MTLAWKLLKLPGGNKSRSFRGLKPEPVVVTMHHDLTAAPQIDPTAVYRWRDGLYAVDLLACAIVHLDLFTFLAQRPATKEEICSHFQITDRPTDVMLTLFVAMGFLRRGTGSDLELTPLAREHLVRSSPFYLGPYYASLKDRPVCEDFLRVLRSDKPANWGSFKQEKDWAHAMEEEAFAQKFTAAMDCRGVFLGQAMAKAYDLSDRRKLLDIAGGSGIYACSLTARWSNLTAAVFERAPVHQVAAAAIAKRGFSERVQVIEGDMFQSELPGGFDVHLISNVLHDWNERTVIELLRKSHSALETDGLLIIHDVHINEEKTGPLPNAAYSALLMHSTEGKCYSLSELYPLLTQVGFFDFNFSATGADRSIITAVKK
jgi:predicted O-methyltransferase YrrM